MKKGVLFVCLAAVPALLACRPETGFIEDAVMPRYGLVERTADTVGRYLCEGEAADVTGYEITENGKCLLMRTDGTGTESWSEGLLEELQLPEGRKEPYGGEYLPGEDLLTDNLCRSWAPAKTMVSVWGKGMPAVGAVFEGCRIKDFFEYMDRNGMTMKRVRLSDEKKGIVNEALRIRKEYDEGYGSLEVEDVTFTHEGSFFVSLVQGEPYVGSWWWENREEKEFHIEFRLNDSSRTVVATNGYVAFNKEGCNLTFDAAFTSKGKRMSAFVDLVCPLMQ